MEESVREDPAILFSAQRSSLLHTILPALRFFLYKAYKILFGPEELIDLFRAQRLGKFSIVFFPDIQQGFIQQDLVLMFAVGQVGLADLHGIFIIDRPESLGFFGREIKPLGDK